MSDQKKYQIIFVHGTWGHASPWVNFDATPVPALLGRLRTEFSSKARIEPFYWTGKNRSTHRRQATINLARYVHKSLSKLEVEKIFLVAHSHGGNVCHDMISMLPPSEAKRVHCFYLGTPFIIRKKRFGNIISHDEDTPLNSQMIHACLFSVLGVVPALIFGLGWNPFDFSQSNYSLILDFWRAPHIGLQIKQQMTASFIFWLVFSFLACMISSLVITDLQNRPERRPRKTVLRERNDHAITYSTDEALMGLQLVSTLTNFVHQILFVVLSVIWRIVNKGNVFQVAIKCAILAGVGVFFLYYYLYLSLLSNFWSFAPVETILNGIVRIVFPIAAAILLVMLFLAIATCGIILIITLFGLFRGLVLLIAGATDREFPRNMVQRLLYDEFSVAATPIGTSSITLVAGNRLVNHTQIYGDTETIDTIVDKMKRQISKRSKRSPHERSDIRG